jgi:hypothetical protein
LNPPHLKGAGGSIIVICPERILEIPTWKGVFFHHADPTKANFLEAVNYSIDLMSCKLKNAKFPRPEVERLLNYFDRIIE